MDLRASLVDLGQGSGFKYVYGGFNSSLADSNKFLVDLSQFSFKSVLVDLSKFFLWI